MEEVTAGEDLEVDEEAVEDFKQFVYNFNHIFFEIFFLALEEAK